MLRFVKEVEVREKREYNLEISEEYLSRLNKDLINLAADSTAVPVITEEVIKAIYDDNDELNSEFKIKGFNGTTATVLLFDLIDKWLNEDAWEVEYDVVDESIEYEWSDLRRY